MDPPAGLVEDYTRRSAYAAGGSSDRTLSGAFQAGHYPYGTLARADLFGNPLPGGLSLYPGSTLETNLTPTYRGAPGKSRGRSGCARAPTPFLDTTRFLAMPAKLPARNTTLSNLICGLPATLPYRSSPPSAQEDPSAPLPLGRALRALLSRSSSRTTTRRGAYSAGALWRHYRGSSPPRVFRRTAACGGSPRGLSARPLWGPKRGALWAAAAASQCHKPSARDVTRTPLSPLLADDIQTLEPGFPSVRSLCP